VPVEPSDPLIRAFEARVREDPAAPLLASPSRRASRGDVDALARAAGVVLGASGVEPEARVVLCAPNGPGFLASFLALRRSGLVPILSDAGSAGSELVRAARRLGAAAVLRCATGWPSGPGAWQCDLVSGRDAVALPEGADLIKLTSGSSGDPRGVAARSESLLADDEAITASMGLRGWDRFLATLPFSHSYGFSSLMVPALVRGTLLVIPDDGGPWSPFAAAREFEATFFPSVPVWLDGLLRFSDPPPVPPTLRRVITAGAPLSAETSARFRERYGLRIQVFYGASEVGGICFDREGGAAERGTVGSPLEGVRVTIEDDEGAPAEGEGAVVVRSPGAGLGYVPGSDPRLRDAVFRSGDRAAWVGSEVALRGRRDDWINVGGKKVDPREVEVILGSLPGVEEVAVVGMPVRGGERVRAVIACAPGRLCHEEVRAWCRGRLAAHKLPRSVIFLERLPRNARGKLDREAMRSLGSAP
jgi:long-chain acyl-CoA synthetase